jgi:hypothetical protein
MCSSCRVAVAELGARLAVRTSGIVVGVDGSAQPVDALRFAIEESRYALSATERGRPRCVACSATR